MIASEAHIEHIRMKMLDALQRKPCSLFSWPDDACAAEPWGYWVHVSWVPAWNATNRVQEADDFLRGWLTDENIAAALKLPPAPPPPLLESYAAERLKRWLEVPP